MCVVLSGSDGFVGNYLRKELESQGKEVIGFDLKNGQDLRNYEQVRNFLDKYRPTEIYHLAAQANVAESFKNPIRTFEVNTIGSINLLEAVRQLSLICKIQLAGTSEEYGDSENLEDSRLTPQSPYAISKIAMDYMGQLYSKAYGLHIVTTRAFNHTGANRGEMYAESAWAKQIVEIENGKREFLEHGNLESIRNYTDVRDVVKAYTLAIQLNPGVYNICSNQNLKMKRVLDILISLSTTTIKAKENKSLGRPSDFSFREPSCEKLTSLVNWKPKYTIEQTLRDLLNDWRKKYV
jgi:GDP-4-dehydro-6-deoxy-D-mannose reductase